MFCFFMIAILFGIRGFRYGGNADPNTYFIGFSIQRQKTGKFEETSLVIFTR